MKKVSVILLTLALMAMVCISFADGAPTINLSETEITMFKGKTERIQVTVENVENPKKVKYAWETSDKTVATVNNGTVKAVDGGNSIITCTATLEDGSTIQAQVNITVKVPVTALKLQNKGDVKIQSGSSEKISYEVAPSNATDQSLTWSSSDESIATVDQNGIVTAKSAGKAKIIAVTNDGSNKKIQANIYVPSLYCVSSTVEIDDLEGTNVDLYYYGDSWNSDVTIKQKGECFDYDVSNDGSKYQIKLSPVSIGKGSLIINDKKDSKSKIQLDVNVTDNAIPIYQYLVITDASYENGIVNMTVKNVSGKAIDYFAFVVIPYNSSNEVMYFTQIDDYAVETMTIEKLKHLKANSSATLSEEVGNRVTNEQIDHIDIALDWVNTIEGKEYTKHAISDPNHYWYSTKTNSYKERPQGNGFDGYYEFTTKDNSKSFIIGCFTKPVREWEANHFGYHDGGRYILEVAPDSIADKAGLRVKDMIVAIDGVKWSEDRSILEKAKSRLYEGSTAVLTVERQGETIDLILKNSD